MRIEGGMKLYYSPGACSLHPHITLREAGIPFELERVDLRAHKLHDGTDYYSINPKGYVPALRLDDGSLLTEGAVIDQFVADKNPQAKILPPAGTFERWSAGTTREHRRWPVPRPSCCRAAPGTRSRR